MVFLLSSNTGIGVTKGKEEQLRSKSSKHTGCKTNKHHKNAKCSDVKCLNMCETIRDRNIRKEVYKKKKFDWTSSSDEDLVLFVLTRKKKKRFWVKVGLEGEVFSSQQVC